jgi:3-hydroxyacyl-[acyl-carrier-protein] dehydratase
MPVTLPLDHEQIKQFIPHRYPFLLVDRVTEIEGETLIRGFKHVSANEPFFQGHFPARAIMPGVLIVEALAQLGAILGFIASGNRYDDGYLYLLAGVDQARFKRSVVPGDRLDLEVEILGGKRGIYRMACRAHVGSELACQAEILCAERRSEQ